MSSEDLTTKVAPHPTLSRFYGEESRRAGYLRDLFDKTAVHYDWVNQILSFGTGQRYRHEALARHGVTAGMKVLDVATGTGGVARAAAKLVGAEGKVLGLDASLGMLVESKRRLNASAVQAFAEAMPLASDSFDFVSMGYAMRHLPDLVGGFREYFRVLKPGGRVLILEITPPRNRAGFWFLKAYMSRLAPLIVRIGTRSERAKEMMDYYWETTAGCVAPETIIEALQAAGFDEVKRVSMHGMLSEYTGVKRGRVASSE